MTLAAFRTAVELRSGMRIIYSATKVLEPAWQASFDGTDKYARLIGIKKVGVFLNHCMAWAVSTGM